MSEVAARGSAPRSGRVSARGGRGGHSSRGGRGGSFKTAKVASPAFEDDSEMAQLKSRYASSVKTVKEIFPQFTDEDVVVALEENGGDLETTINKISSGAVSQWEEAPSKKDKPKSSKPGELGTGEFSYMSKSARGRGGSENARAGRGRTSERGGRGVARGTKAGTSTSSAKTSSAVITEPGWEVVPDNIGSTDNETPDSSTPATWDVAGSTQAAKENTSALPSATTPDVTKLVAKANGTTRSWADLVKPAPKPKPVPVPAPVEKPVSAPVPQIQELPAEPAHPPEPMEDTKPAISDLAEALEPVEPVASPSLPSSEPAINIVPSEDKLTEENLEQVKDVSHPVATDTVASTVGTEDPRSTVGTPLQSRDAASKTAGGGFAATALKATQGSSRPSGLHRRVKEQSEAVVMPGNHAVDRAAVQFGSLGLGGSSEDVDDEREEAETRAQPPQHSPIAPRASLPIAPQQVSVPVENTPTLRAAPGLTADPAQAPQVDAQALSQSQAPYDQLTSRFTGLAGNHASTTNTSKSYEAFGQQLAASSSHPFDSYGAHSQAPGQQAQTVSSYLGGFGANEYGSYNEYQRNAQLYGAFGQQTQASQETATQRASSGFGSSAADAPSQYTTNHAPQNRFGAANEALNSGHSTPAPGTSQPTPSQGHSQSHHLGGHAQTGGHAPYGNYYGGAYNNAFYNQPMANPSHHQPYGRDRPAFDDARRYDDSYMSQTHHYGYSGYGSYGTGPYAGKYGGPNQYGISPQTSYDTHSASPANTFGRDSGPGGFGSYARTGSTHPESSQQSQHSVTGAYGSVNDPFGRNASSFPGQSSQQQAQQSAVDDSSRFGGDSSKLQAGGPSPVPNQQRPGSATNNTQTAQSSQTQGQQGYSGYPQSGLGGFGGAHHQGGAGGHHTAYSGYGGGFGGPYYGVGRGNTWGYGAS